jgi:PhoD-like phosphatase
MASGVTQRRLRLGPIVGHTDDSTARIWIRVRRPSDLASATARYRLRVRGRGTFPFVSTEGMGSEFGTAVAVASGLRSDWHYAYDVTRDGRMVAGTQGGFRTMPTPGSFADILFVTVSCGHPSDPGAWPLLQTYIEEAKPRFLLMIGDQVYLDEDEKTWQTMLHTDSSARRLAMAAIYDRHWSRQPLQTILANIPTYMMWDDHDICNGWGSSPADSPVLAEMFPKGAAIFRQKAKYFEDARSLYWHFQVAHGVRSSPDESFKPGIRHGLPFSFQCGRLIVTVLDDRGERDVWRPQRPVLGESQWAYLHATVEKLPATVDAFALVVPLPVTSMSPDGVTQKLLGWRTDDIDLFREGKADELLSLGGRSEKNFGHLVLAAAGALAGQNWGRFKVADLSDVRDNWAHHLARPELEQLIHLAISARTANRPGGTPRAVTLIGGDLHVGGLFDVDVDDPPCRISSLVTSGIGRQTDEPDWPAALVGTLVDEKYNLSDGIAVRLRSFARVYNFGATHVMPGGGTAEVTHDLGYSGNNTYRTLRVGARS